MGRAIPAGCPTDRLTAKEYVVGGGRHKLASVMTRRFVASGVIVLASKDFGALAKYGQSGSW